MLSLDIQLLERVVTPLIGLNAPHFFVCPMSGPGASTPYFHGLYVLSDLKRVRFVGIGGIVDN